MVWSVNHHPRHGSVPEMARSLVRRIEALKEATGAAQVDVVGHSIGGVVTAWAPAPPEAPPGLRRPITIRPPWRRPRLPLFKLHHEGCHWRPGPPGVHHPGVGVSGGALFVGEMRPASAA